MLACDGAAPETRSVPPGLNVLLLSTYELGHQPLGVARPAAHLRAAGHHVVCNDLSVERLDEAAVRQAELIGISAPMHTATRLGMRLAERVRSLNPRAHLCFYGLYASLNAEGLLGRYADSAIGGEFETPLAELAERLARCGGISPAAPARGVLTVDGGGVFLGRQELALPSRDLLPPLEKYARLDDGSEQRLVGYVEASRGCAHRCLHCPITPVYGGRMRIVPSEIVLDDVRQLVELGAGHITFGDPDFCNGVKHSLRIVEALHAEFPALTYDATIKVEHLLEHRMLLPRLRDSGCLFVVSAVEAVDDRILAHLRKGHSATDVEAAFDLADAIGLIIRPTFVPFTPWTTLDGYLELLEFVERRGLIRHLDTVQLAIRLLVPRGSSLVGTPAFEPHLGPFDEASLTYVWQHPDPRLDQLQREVAAIAERAAASGEQPEASFARVKSLALGLARGRAVRVRPVSPPRAPVPRLTEPWFC